MEILDATARSLAFLTRLPPARWALSGDHPLGYDAYAFPIAGLLAAIPSALVVLVADRLGLSSLVSGVLAVGVMVAVTGGLHEDGLGDVADGLGGHQEKTRALEIMKDSRVGSYGALALIFSVALRVALLADIAVVSAGAAALGILGVAAASRGAMAFLWSSLPPAYPGGLADTVGRPTEETGRNALGLGAVLFVLLGGLAAGALGALAGLLLALLSYLWFWSVLKRRLGGQTGDTLGAMQQITEIALLLGLAVAL